MLIEERQIDADRSDNQMHRSYASGGSSSYNASNKSSISAVADRSRCLGALAMKNIHEVLRLKEMDLIRVRGEIAALRSVIPLLAEPGAPVVAVPDMPSPRLFQRNKWPLQVGESQPVGMEPT